MSEVSPVETGKLATQEGKYSVAVLKHGAAPQLVAMLTQVCLCGCNMILAIPCLQEDGCHCNHAVIAAMYRCNLCPDMHHSPSIYLYLQEHKGQSAGVKVGVQRCALRAIMLCLGDAQLRSALQQAHLAETLQVHAPRCL